MSKVKEKEKIIECDVCKGTFPAKEVSFLKGAMLNRKQETMEVKYFVCPHCGKHYVITITDRRAKQLMEKYDKATAKLKRMPSVNPVIRKQLADAYEQSKDAYIDYQHQLKSMYADKFVPNVEANH